MSEAKKKLTFKVALFGILGLGALGYAAVRRPRYLYDGRVMECEGVVEFSVKSCAELFLTRGSGSGKVFSPFDGSVVSVEETGSGALAETKMVIQASWTPIQFTLRLSGGSPVVRTGSFKTGDVIAQTERLIVSAGQVEGSSIAPMSASAWLIANALYPASQKGSLWCEDSNQVIVPLCPGITFRAPELPKWSLRSVRMSM